MQNETQKGDFSLQEAAAMGAPNVEPPCPECGKSPDLIVDRETVQILLDLLNPLHGSIDRQVMDQVTDERELDAPSDREYNVDVTARMERDLTQAVMILEDRLRQASALTGGTSNSETE